MAELAPVNRPSDECHWILLMISQHRVRHWLGAARYQASTWTNVDLDICHLMASLGHNELMLSQYLKKINNETRLCTTRGFMLSSGMNFTQQSNPCHISNYHDDVIKWKHFPRYWPFVGEFTGDKGQWRGTLMFSLMCARINGWVNNGEAGDLRRHRAHCDVIVMMHHKSTLLIFIKK